MLSMALVSGLMLAILSTISPSMNIVHALTLQGGNGGDGGAGGGGGTSGDTSISDSSNGGGGGGGGTHL